VIWKPLKQGTDLIPETRQARQVAWLALIAIGGIIYFFVAVIILHFLRPEYNPVNHAVSNYAVGPYGYLMTAAFYALALSVFALALGLTRSIALTNLSWVSVLLEHSKCWHDSDGNFSWRCECPTSACDNNGRDPLDCCWCVLLEYHDCRVPLVKLLQDG
jgi:Protein of unknown function (DUF998)